MRRLLLAAPLLLAAAIGFAQDAARDAKRAFDAGRFREAGEKYAKAAESAAADRKADLYLQSAWSYYIAGSSKSAREELKAAIAARPDLQVIPDFYSPDFASLASAVRAEVAGANVPAVDIDELKRSARAKLADGKAEDALYDLKRATGSTDPEVYRLMAEADDKLGKGADADANRRKAAELEKGLVSSVPIGSGTGATPESPAAPGAPGAPSGPASAAPLLESADKAVAAGDFKAAAFYARQASEADPRNADAHRILGDAALAANQNTDAEREYTAAIVLDLANAKAEYGLAVVAELQKKWNTAASHYRRALDLNPKSVSAARGLGRAMSELGDKSAARIAFGRAIEIDPASAEARNDFGVFLYRSDEIDRSIEELIEAVRLDSASALYHENLGRAYRRKSRWKEAERELEATSKVAPNDTAVWVALASTRAAEKKLDDAAAAYATALEIDPLDEEAAAGLGATLRAQGKLAEADAALAKSLSSIAKSPVLWNNLGVVRVERGQYAQAVDAFQKALAIDGGFEAARANLARAKDLAALDRAAS